MKPTPDPDDNTEKIEAALRAEITALRDGLDAITDGFILFNADDRVVAFNASRSDLFPSFADILDVGVNYRDLLHSQLEQGQIDSATGREEEWIEDRTKNHQIADGTPTEQVFADGRVIRLREHRTSSGGIVSVRTDITDLKKMPNVAWKIANRPSAPCLRRPRFRWSWPRRGSICTPIRKPTIYSVWKWENWSAGKPGISMLTPMSMPKLYLS